MAFYVIAGKSNCPNTTHALHVSDYLSKNLPHFSYRSVIKGDKEWPTWLDELNNINGWHQTRSPVIWKEISRMGAKKYLIGGLSEFWEYCYDYYGFQSRMSREDINKIMKDNALIASRKAENKVQTISILGFGSADDQFLQLNIYELQNCFTSKQEAELEIRLYDKKLDDPDEEDLMLETVDDLRDIIKGIPLHLHLVLSQEAAITNCDLLIITEDFSREPGEDLDLWLDRCRQKMIILADDINHYAKRNLRIVLNHHGPVCFTASILMEYCTTIRLTNIVAITTDEGISVIHHMAEKINEQVKNFWCPPVWGFCGIMSYIALPGTCIKADIYRPFKRSLKTKETCHLPKGQIQQEIRYLGNLIKIEDELYEEIEERQKREKEMLGRNAVLPKVRALGSLLSRWYADEICDDILSLGIYSNGTFGFPVGICVSQPVILNQKRVWESIPNLPLHDSTKAKITSISLHIENTLKKFGLGDRSLYVD